MIRHSYLITNDFFCSGLVLLMVFYSVVDNCIHIMFAAPLSRSYLKDSLGVFYFANHCNAL